MLVDAHSHLDRFDRAGGSALASAIEEIAGLGILTLANSMDPASYRRNLEIGGMCRWVVPCFGVHPWNAPLYADRLGNLAADTERSTMLGEIGLDYHFVKDSSSYPAQREVFEFFLSAARDQDKIVNLHTKGAERDVLDLLRRYAVHRVIIHWYSGPLDVFRELAAMGSHFTVGMEVLRSKHIRAIAREIRPDRLLTETDNPGGPRQVTGSDGSPAAIREVLGGLAAARGSECREIEETVQANMLNLMRDDPHLADALAWIEGKLICGRDAT